MAQTKAADAILAELATEEEVDSAAEQLLRAELVASANRENARRALRSRDVRNDH